MPMYYVPLTGLAMGSVNEEETASAAGLMNFVRTISGAIATSLVTTSWQNRSIIAHAKLADIVDPTGQVASMLPPGLSGQMVREMLNNLVTQPEPDARHQRPDDGDRRGLHHRIRFDRARAQSGSSGRRCLDRALSPLANCARRYRNMVTTRSRLHRCWQARALRWTFVLGVFALVGCTALPRRDAPPTLFSSATPRGFSCRRALPEHGSGERRERNPQPLCSD